MSQKTLSLMLPGPEIRLLVAYEQVLNKNFPKQYNNKKQFSWEKHIILIIKKLENHFYLAIL